MIQPVAVATCRGHHLVTVQGVVNRLAVRGLGAIASAHSTLLEPCEQDGLSWLLVMLRHGRTSLLTSRSRMAMPRVVGVWRGPGVGVRALARGLAFLEPSPERSGKARSLPEGLGKAEPLPEGSGETEPFLVGPDRAATTLIIVLDGLRLMSFNSYLMGTIILVPDKMFHHSP
jgi:hypothetical protein